MSIPKIIHQLWIGDKQAPINLMNTWKNKNPDYEYIYWNENEIEKREINFSCQKRINEIEEINGKADIMRWEILYKYGGIFIDADSICVEPFDQNIINKKCFAGWENEEKRPGLIATGTMGFPPNHPLVKEAIDWIKKNNVSIEITGKMAWENVGPGLLTNIYNMGIFKDLFIFPSYTFLPLHFTGIEYKGHGKIYAFQEWGSTRQSYDFMNNAKLFNTYNTPPTENSVSVLISSYNTKTIYIKECLDSIKHQIGWFNMEIVWIDDGSDELNSSILKKTLDHFKLTSRFTSIKYIKNEKNMGIGYSLNLGIRECSHELIFKMDSDDIMLPNRMVTQITYMVNNPTVQICGGQIVMFKNNLQNIVQKTQHEPIFWENYKLNPLHWLVNHPTLCYKKSAILKVGNYDPKFTKVEDFELMLRILKEYKYIHNMKDTLVYYRLHDEQTTHNGCTEGHQYWHKRRTELINNIIYK
jgi:GT2 family glycosyltransferase